MRPHVCGHIYIFAAIILYEVHIIYNVVYTWVYNQYEDTYHKRRRKGCLSESYLHNAPLCSILNVGEI